jgi:hypothetical protein
VWGEPAANCKDSILLSTFSEKAAGPVVSHNISPDELEKGQCQRMAVVGDSGRKKQEVD